MGDPDCWVSEEYVQGVLEDIRAEEERERQVDAIRRFFDVHLDRRFFEAMPFKWQVHLTNRLWDCSPDELVDDSVLVEFFVFPT